jgi:hypothetical protein
MSSYKLTKIELFNRSEHPLHNLIFSGSKDLSVESFTESLNSKNNKTKQKQTKNKQTNSFTEIKKI